MIDGLPIGAIIDGEAQGSSAYSFVGGDMVGFFGGIGLAFFYVSRSAHQDWGVGPWALAAFSIGVFLCGVVLGVLLRYTIGFAAMWAMLGAAISAVIEFATGHIAYGFALLPHVVSLWAIGQVLASLTYGPGTSPLRSVGSLIGHGQGTEGFVALHS